MEKKDVTMEIILEQFADFLEEHPLMDICRTRFGYALVYFEPKREQFFNVPMLIKTPADLVEVFWEEIVMDVLKSTDHDLDDATKEELAEIAKRQGVYKERLKKNPETACLGA